MEISLFKKKRSVSLLGLHPQDISPEHDWLVMLGVSSGIIVLSIIFSTILFYQALHPSAQNNLSSDPNQEIVVNRNLLNSALEFINSRKAE